jgi:hypothetical protein
LCDSEDGCTEWGAGDRFYLCGDKEIVDTESFKTYCPAAKAAADNSCDKDPKRPTLGSTKLKEPCEDCQDAGKWMKNDNGVWQQKQD